MRYAPSQTIQKHSSRSITVLTISNELKSRPNELCFRHRERHVAVVEEFSRKVLELGNWYKLAGRTDTYTKSPDLDEKYHLLWFTVQLERGGLNRLSCVRTDSSKVDELIKQRHEGFVSRAGPAK